MGFLEFGLGKPIRMDIRPGFLKGIPVEIFWRTRWRRIAAGMLAAAAFLFNEAAQGQLQAKYYLRRVHSLSLIQGQVRG